MTYSYEAATAQCGTTTSSPESCAEPPQVSGSARAHAQQALPGGSLELPLQKNSETCFFPGPKRWVSKQRAVPKRGCLALRLLIVADSAHCSCFTTLPGNCRSRTFLGVALVLCLRLLRDVLVSPPSGRHIRSVWECGDTPLGLPGGSEKPSGLSRQVGANRLPGSQTSQAVLEDSCPWLSLAEGWD